MRVSNAIMGVGLLLLGGCPQSSTSGTDDMSVTGMMDLSGTIEGDLAGADLAGADLSRASSDLATRDGSAGDSATAPGDMANSGPADASSMIGRDGFVGCGSIPCAWPNYCCIKPTGYTCELGDGVQCLDNGGTPTFCDSAGSTCPSGKICCIQNGAVLCNNTCAGTQVCSPAVSGECASGTCQPYNGTQPALPGYYACQ